MDKKERLEYCKACQKRVFDLNRGILCSITHDYADFEESCPDYVRDEKTHALESYRSEQLRAEKKKIQQTEERRRQKKRDKASWRRRIPEKIRLNDLLLLTGFGLIAVFIIRLFYYKSFSYSNNIDSWYVLLVIYLSSVITLLLRKREAWKIRVFGDMKFKALFTVAISLINFLYILIVPTYSYQKGAILLAFLSYSFILSLLSVIITIPANRLFRKTLRSNVILIRTLIASGSFLVLSLGIVEGDLFIKREKVGWDPQNSIRIENFRGYPNFLTDYSAAISSRFEYEIMGNTYDSVQINALMYPHHSWVKKAYVDSELLLRHEQYHFNISEVFARKFKKQLYSLEGDEIDRKRVVQLYNTYLRELNVMQDKYDHDCDHGLLYERQKDWEYLIDSMLNAHAYYEDEIMKLATRSCAESNFYRSIKTDGKKQIIGRHCMDSSIARYAPHYAFTYKDHKLSHIAYYNSRELAIDEYFQVSAIQFHYGEGKEWKHFFDTSGNRMKNKFGVYGQVIERGARKMVVTNIDDQGNPMNSDDGVCTVEWDLDHHGRRSSGAQYNKEGNRITDNRGEYIISYKYDHRGNLIEHANYDDAYSLSDDYSGIAYKRYLYDVMDNLVGVQHYNKNYKLVPDGNGIVAWMGNYDRDGNIIRTHYQRADGSRHTDEDGVAISYFTYDRLGKIIEEKHYGNNMNLNINKQGLGRIQRDYDSLLRVIETRNFDAYDNYLNDASNMCKTFFTYNDQDKISEKDCFYLDSADNVCHLKTIAYSYDDHSNLIEERYYDEEGELLADSSSVCIKRFTYDQDHHLIEESCYNSQGELHPFSARIVTSRYRYDANSMRTETAYYDEDDRLTENEGGIAKEINHYNDQQLRIAVQYFDANNKPTKYDLGVEEVKWTYNADNRLIREAYYNSEEQLTLNNKDYAYFEYAIDHTGTIQSVRFYNTHSDLVEEEHDGIAMVEYDYSKTGLVSRYSMKDKHARLRNTPQGYAIENLYYNSNNQVIRSEYLSKLKQLVVSSDGYASRNWMYDQNGNAIAVIYRDETNALIEDEDGFAIYNYLYNRNGEVTASNAFSADDRNLDSIDHGDFTVMLYPYYGMEEHGATHKTGTDVRTSYYNNGQKQSEGVYIDGKLEGKYLTWYENGLISSEIEYINGKRNGKTIDYYNNGMKWRELNYRNGNIIFDSEVSWHMNGQIQSRYVNGEEVCWDEKGNRI